MTDLHPRSADGTSVPPPARSVAPLAAYALAVLLTLAAYGLRQSLGVSFTQRPLLILFMLPIILSALLGGLGPGLLATVTAGLVTTWIMPPAGTLVMAAVHDQLQWGMLLLNGVLVSLLSDNLYHSRQREHRRSLDLAATQARLQESETRFQASFDQAAVGLAMVAPDGRFLRVNAALCDMLGYSRRELQNLGFPDLTLVEELAADRAGLDRLLAGELTRYARDKRYLRKDGSMVWAAVSVALVRGLDGSPDHFAAVVVDIQARKDAELAEKSTAEALRETQRLVGMGTWSWDLLTNSKTWSEETYALFGRDPAQRPAVDLEFQACFTAESWPRLVRALDRARTMGEPYECDVEVVRPDGSHRWIVARGEARRDAIGAIVGLHGTVQDISARKGAEASFQIAQANALEKQRHARLAALNLVEDAVAARRALEEGNAALRASEGRLRTLLDTLPELVWLKDPEGVYLLCNPRGEELFGAREADILGRTDFDFVPRELAELFREKDRAAIAAGGPSVNEEEVIYPDGHRAILETIKTPMFDAQGGLVGVLGIARDITAFRQAEGDLRKLSMAVEQNPESILITNSRGEIEYVNEAFVRTTGYSRQEAVGRNPRMLQSGQTPRETYGSLRQTLAQGKPWHGEFINRRKTGEVYYEFATISPIRQADGRITHYVAVQEDITEKKRLGQELDRHRHHLEELVAERTRQLAEAKELAESASRAKSAFLANMSHEIRTPMNAIVGLTHLLRRDGVAPHQADRIEKIQGAAQHLLSILNDILDLSKIEAGRVELEQVAFAPASILDHVRGLVADQADAKGLALTVEYGPLPPALVGDPTRLRQALLNYAGNAVKFTEHGRICLRARVAEEGEAGLLVRFEVEDTGIGIPAEHQGRLFQAFEQADVSTTRKYGGTGLGLAVTQRLARLMGGECGFVSRPGEGSTFWFTARLRHSRGVAPVPTEVAPASAETLLRRRCAGMRVLLAEDNPINREVAVELLNQVGLAVDTAEDGAQALEMLDAGAYALVLMDVHMPRMDGLETTRAIRARNAQPRLPVLAMTAGAFDNDRQACTDAGMDDFVAKPVVPEALYIALLRWLPDGQGQAVPPPGQGVDGAAPAGSAPAAVPDLLDRLSAIPGLDTAQGLAMVRHDGARYLRLLRMFAASHGEDLTQLRKALAEGGREAAMHLAHSLKGVSGTLGARRLSALAGEIESALRTEAPPAQCAGLAVACQGQLAELVAGIQAVAADPPAGGMPSAGAECPPLEEVLADLERLLAENNTRAGRLARDHAGRLGQALGGREDIFLRQIEHFDFEAALETLQQALDRPAAP